MKLNQKPQTCYFLAILVAAALLLTLPPGLLIGVFLLGVFFNGVFLAGLFAFRVCVPFLKLVDRRAVALNRIRTLSDAEMGFVSLVADLVAGFFFVAC